MKNRVLQLKDNFQKDLDSISKFCDYAELRAIKREKLRIRYRKREQDDVDVANNFGVAVRVLVDGSWGTSYTSEATGVQSSLTRAIKIASITSQRRQNKVHLAEYKPQTGKFEVSILDDIKNHSIEEKIELISNIDNQLMKGESISSSAVFYTEYDENKLILNTDGVDVYVHDQKVDLSMAAVAYEAGEMITGSEDIGRTGGFENIKNYPINEAIESSISLAQQKLRAKHAKGGKTNLVLDSSLVGLLAHEAIGHSLEADFILSGSAARDHFGEKVASPLITIIDDGSQFPNSSGWIVVDDEGVKKQKTELIKNGIMVGALTNRETAEILNMTPTGNARAWSFIDEPIIRMTTTYVQAGEWSLKDIIQDTKDGFYLKKAAGGQADASADFMFNADYVQKIENGELKEIYRATAINGNAFEVLTSVDAVGKDWKLDGGGGFCLKGQPIKVDSGGPSIRCVGLLGGSDC